MHEPEPVHQYRPSEKVPVQGAYYPPSEATRHRGIARAADQSHLRSEARRAILARALANEAKMFPLDQTTDLDPSHVTPRPVRETVVVPSLNLVEHPATSPYPDRDLGRHNAARELQEVAEAYGEAKPRSKA
jgi:hypothetical protein